MKYAPVYIFLIAIAGIGALWVPDRIFDASAYDFSVNHDCRDFSSWREAQSFYEAAGPGDPNGLDADGDGIACEALR